MKRSATATVPGKLILFGEHSVVHGKLALATSLGLYTRGFATLTEDATVRLLLPDLAPAEQHTEWTLERLLAVQSQAQTLCSNASDVSLVSALQLSAQLEEHLHELTSSKGIKAFLFFLLSAIDLSKLSPSSGVTLRIVSELPRGAGLGSSAAYSVALVASMLHLFGVAANDDQLALINAWAYQCERVLHGNPSGVDNSVCTYGNRACCDFSRFPGSFLRFTRPAGMQKVQG
jgi:mevalonate kinase